MCVIVFNWIDGMLVYNKIKSITCEQAKISLVTFEVLVVQNVFLGRQLFLTSFCVDSVEYATSDQLIQCGDMKTKTNQTNHEDF